MNNYKYSAFSGYGIEIEYAIVDVQSLKIRSIADSLLAGAEDMDVPRGDAAWSNELALHVIETKTDGPISDLARARDIFRREVDAINALLSAQGAQLMPTGMHPFMDPLTETRLWPHQNNEIYQSFDRIFGCEGHGWSNLQSMHINFPFKNEEEFERLHAACRVVLPLLPAVSASSPFWEGRRAPHLDQRLAVYRTNCTKVPSVTGQVIPEAVFSYAAYQAMLQGIYADIAPLDQDGILQEEWLNARGAIARFDRGAIEIRVIDTQECPEQDLAIAFFVTELVRGLAQGSFCDLDEQKQKSTQDLASLFHAAVQIGGQALVPAEYGALFSSSASTLRQLFFELINRLVPSSSPHRAGLDVIAQQGSLAERLVSRLPADRPHPEDLRRVYGELCTHLREGTPYVGSM